MPGLFRFLHGPSLRRIALALLVALQGAITAAPLIEPSEKGRLGSHAEERGAQHKYQHDESTCAVCAVRSLPSSPARASTRIAYGRVQTVASLESSPISLSRVDPTTLPRAPPRLT